VARDTFTDARLAETIADDVLQDHFIWVSGLGWLRWDGNRWADATDVEVIETAREYVLDRFRQELDAGAHDLGREFCGSWEAHSVTRGGAIGADIRRRRICVCVSRNFHES
jgi:hypothetical protein